MLNFFWISSENHGFENPSLKIDGLGRPNHLNLCQLHLWLRGHGHPQDYATHIFFTDSKSFTLGLWNEVSIVSEYIWKDGENQENIFPL